MLPNIVHSLTALRLVSGSLQDFQDRLEFRRVD
jgi:hypothetical protein